MGRRRFKRTLFKRRRSTFIRRKVFTGARRFRYKGIKTFAIPNVSSQFISFAVTGSSITPGEVNFNTIPLGRSYKNLTDIIQNYQRLKLKTIVWSMSNFKLQSKLKDTAGQQDIEIEDLRSFGIWLYHDIWDRGSPTEVEVQEVAIKKNVVDGNASTMFFGKHNIPSAGSLASSDLPPADLDITTFLARIEDPASLVNSSGAEEKKFFNLKFAFYPQVSSIETTGEEQSYILSFVFKTTAIWSASKLKIAAE